MTKNIPIAERLIFALDVDTQDQAAEWLSRLGERVHFYKVGLQLFLGGWFPVIDLIRNRGHKVMVDLKFFDIPETVELAVRQLKDRGVEFITVHGNEEILKAANRTKNGSKILAVTLLTSFDEADLRDMGLTCDIETFVLYRARKALRLGCDGVISSGIEAAALRRDLGDQFLIVTPASAQAPTPRPTTTIKSGSLRLMKPSAMAPTMSWSAARSVMLTIQSQWWRLCTQKSLALF